MSSPSSLKRPRPPEDAAWSVTTAANNDSTTTTTTITVTASTKVCITGHGQLRCLNGSATAHGYQLSQHQAVAFESPVWASWLTLDVVVNDDASTTTLEIVGDNVQVHDPYEEKARPTILPSSWKQAVDDILTDDMNANSPSTSIAVCGAKNVGKSTCLRYLIHRLLSNGHKVALLDADCGQPETAPPGLVSLRILGPHEPLLTPPHSYHAKDFCRAYFYGSNTSQTDPPLYMECIQQLVQDFEQQHDDGMVLCINLDGNVKGLGEQVLNALLASTIRPKHVIQMVGQTKSQQFELVHSSHSAPFRVHVAHAYNKTNDDDEQAAKDNDTESLLTAQPSLSIAAAELRSLRLCCYFTGRRLMDDNVVAFGQDGMHDPTNSIAKELASMRPYAVRMDAVEWHCGSRDLTTMTTMLQAMNGSIVGLCCRSSSSETPLHLLPCLGLGLIRAVDTQQGVFYILTPVDGKELGAVNVLVKGNILLPLIGYHRGVETESFLYQTVDKTGVLGSDPMVSRNSIARRGLMGNR